LDVERFADGTEEIVVEVVETVQAAGACLQVVAKAVGFARFEEGEHGSFILGQLAEERAKDDRDQRVERVAAPKEVTELAARPVRWSELQLPRQLAERPKTLLRGGWNPRELSAVR
jgi:hypothetical protein